MHGLAGGENAPPQRPSSAATARARARTWMQDVKFPTLRMSRNNDPSTAGAASARPQALNSNSFSIFDVNGNGSGGGVGVDSMQYPTSPSFNRNAAKEVAANAGAAARGCNRPGEPVTSDSVITQPAEGKEALGLPNSDAARAAGIRADEGGSGLGNAVVQDTAAPDSVLIDLSDRGGDANRHSPAGSPAAPEAGGMKGALLGGISPFVGRQVIPTDDMQQDTDGRNDPEGSPSAH